MTEQEPRENAGDAPHTERPTSDQTSGGEAQPAANVSAPASDAGTSQPTGEPETADSAAAAADVWDTFDAVLQAFGAERGVGVGSFWGEADEAIEGRFAGWANACGWRCTLQLVRAPEENVVVVVAQGPPLPGGRARVMVLGAFPPEFEPDTLRAALEVGYGIGETWGPAEEPSEPPPAAASDTPPGSAP